MASPSALTHPGKVIPKVWTVFLSLLLGLPKVFTPNTWHWAASQPLPSEDPFLPTSQALWGFPFLRCPPPVTLGFWQLSVGFSTPSSCEHPSPCRAQLEFCSRVSL